MFASLRSSLAAWHFGGQLRLHETLSKEKNQLNEGMAEDRDDKPVGVWDFMGTRLCRITF